MILLSWRGVAGGPRAPRAGGGVGPGPDAGADRPRAERGGHQARACPFCGGAAAWLRGAVAAGGVLTLALLGASTGVARAALGDASPASGFSVEQAVEEALRSNAGLTAAMDRWAAARQRAGQQAALPNPMLAYRGMDRSSGGDFPDSAEKRIEFQQPLPGPGKRGLRMESAERDADRVALEYQAAALDLALAVREAAYDYIAARARADLAAAEVTALDGLCSAARGRYETGAGELGDALRADAERAQARQRVLEFGQQAQSAGIRLAALLNRDGSVSIAPEPPALLTNSVRSVDALLAAGARLRPDLRAAQVDVRRARAERRLAGQERLPDYFVGGEYRSIRDGDDQVMLSVGMDLPVWRSGAHSRAREASYLWQAAMSEEAESRRRVESDVRDAYQRLTAARATVRLYADELIPAARLRSEQARSGYAAGRTSFGERVDAELGWLAARRMSVEASADLARAAARLARAVGVTGPSDLIATAAATRE